MNKITFSEQCYYVFGDFKDAARSLPSGTVSMLILISVFTFVVSCWTNICVFDIPYSAKCLRIAILRFCWNEFAACAHCTLNLLWAWHKSLTGLSNTHHTITLPFTQACSCQQSNTYFKGISLGKVSCRFGSLPRDVVNRSSCSQTIKTCHISNIFCWNIFMNDCKILEIKDPQNFVLYSMP